MFRMKTLLAALLLAALTGAIPAMANPTPPAVCDPNTGTYGTPSVRMVITGSSAMFQTVALGAYNKGQGVTGTAVAPTFHYVSNAKFNVVDTRPTTVGGTNLTDTGTAWIVWDSRVVSGKCAPNVWIYVSIDSVAGNRAFFGSVGTPAPAGKGVYVQAPATFPADDSGANISNTLWGDGSTGVKPHTAIQGLFTGTKASNLVSVGATDIRPEDAYFAILRVDSDLDSTNAYRGLGYNVNNPSGTAPDVSTNCGGASGLAQLVGDGIFGDYPSAKGDGPFNVAAFNLTGQDPFTCGTLPAFVTIPVGASPIVVIHSNNGGQLNGLANATGYELQQVFSGQKNGTATSSPFSGCPSCTGPFAVYLREPLSGTYNTFDETVMRHPSNLASWRAAQENGVDARSTGAHNNPLSGFDGFRWRAIGTGDEVKSVRDSVTGNATFSKNKDGIGYTFFSYGNVSTIADKANYSYVRLNGVDPIWHNYDPTHDFNPNGVVDPGQPATVGILPGVADLPATCGTAGQFPCNESNLWAPDHYSLVNGTVYNSYSFPNLRNGTYPAWSIVRLITTTAKQAELQKLVDTSNQYVVSTTPDYVPFNPVRDASNNVIDPGLQVLRSHFGCLVETCGQNVFTGNVNPESNGPELGRDAGGAILPIGDTTTGYTQDGPYDNLIVSFQ